MGDPLRQAARRLLTLMKRGAKNQRVDETRFLAALHGADARALFGAVQKHHPDDRADWSFVRYPFFFFQPVIYAGGELEVHPAPFPQRTPTSARSVSTQAAQLRRAVVAPPPSRPITERQANPKRR